MGKKGEQCYFQVDIPKDTDRIIAVQAGVTGLQLPHGMALDDIAGKGCAGSMKVQAENAGNLCYATDVYTGFSLLNKVTPGFVAGMSNAAFINWMVAPYAGNSYQEPDTILIKDCLMLYGCYTDELGKQMDKNLSYIVGLYLWTEKIAKQ